MLRARVLVLVLVAGPVRSVAAQEGGSSDVRTEGPVVSALRVRWSASGASWIGDTLPGVDTEARFRAFQQEFAEDFGGKRPEASAEELGVRMVKSLEERFAGTRVVGWYHRAAGLYQRLEGFYERLDAYASWASRGLDLDPDIESLADGKVAVHVQRRVHGFHLGLDVEDAAAGRVGLRFGGVHRGYHVNLDFGDVPTGRVTFRLKKRLD